MKRSLLASLISSGALFAALAPAVSHAQAFDGQIRFTGKVSAITCKVNGQDAGLGNIKDVPLGTHAPALFLPLAQGARLPASEQPFSIVLSDCSGGGTAAISFDQVATQINTLSGNLRINTTLPATGLEIGIWNAGNGKTSKVTLGQAQAPAEVQTVTWDPAAATPTTGGSLDFMAAYIKTVPTATAVTSGSAGSDIGFIVAYQ
ncbi:MAG: type 1 fimbrial protein [Achromobacter sp.]|jgi:major type 1 subunit fimbrin (pilin)|uniref:fimbrial protein n=1 Tax=Achromobacter sp. TaxID=134375 RepID=UPI002583E802|nr:fimbrial protein [Achromobacter sp.]MCW0205639.1 type 1 fimbrial protein [Achromobacter sp.]